MYLPSHRERILQEIAQNAEKEVSLRRSGLSLYEDSDQFFLVREIEHSEDYFRVIKSETELHNIEVRHCGPYHSLIEMFDDIIDVDMQDGDYDRKDHIIEVKFFNCTLEREDSLFIDNIDTDTYEDKNGKFELIFFDVIYKGKTLNEDGDVIDYIMYKKPISQSIGTGGSSFCTEYVNESEGNAPVVERIDNNMSIGSSASLCLMDLLDLDREDFVPLEEIWDALDQWLEENRPYHVDSSRQSPK